MALPVYSAKSVMRAELAARLGFGANAAASLNTTLLNSFLVRAQEELWERLNWAQRFEQVDVYVAPAEQSIDYPTLLDPNGIWNIQVDYSGDGQWMPVFDGIDYPLDSVENTNSWPRRFERRSAYIWLWPIVNTARSVEITGITKANPAVVTAAAHGLVDGQRIRVEDVGGMVEVTNGLYVVDAPATNSFALHTSADAAINSTAYTTYTTGGTISVGYRLRCEGNLRLGAFAADSDLPTMPEGLVLHMAIAYGKAHYRHPDAQAYMKSVGRRIELARGKEHGNRRYVPMNRNGSVRATERVRPLLISD